MGSDEMKILPRVVVHLALLGRICVVPVCRFLIRTMATHDCNEEHDAPAMLVNVHEGDKQRLGKRCVSERPRDRSAHRHTKSAHPPAIDQPIVWAVTFPSSPKKEVSPTATVFSAGHSGRGM